MRNVRSQRGLQARLSWLQFLARAAGALLLCVTGLVGAETRPGGASGRLEPAALETSFFEGFDGDSAMARRLDSPRWDVLVDSTEPESRGTFRPMQAAYGPDCAPPPATHDVSAFEDAAYLCDGRLLLAVDAAQFARVTVTPNHLLDFSAGEAVLSFRISTARTTNKDAIRILLTPREEATACCMEVPPRAVQIDMVTSFEAPGRDWSTSFHAQVVRDFASESLPTTGAPAYEDVITPSAERLERLEVRLSRTHLRVGLPEHELWWVDAELAPLDWGNAAVQLSISTQKPEECFFHGGVRPPCGPNTWHVDDFSMAPAVPFWLARGDRMWLDAAAPGGVGEAVRFSERAPEGAHLRFAAHGPALEVSFDGGATWRLAELQAQLAYSPEGTNAYWVPAPPGVVEARLRARPWSEWTSPPAGRAWLVEGPSLWGPAAAPDPVATEHPRPVLPTTLGAEPPPPGTEHNPPYVSQRAAGTGVNTFSGNMTLRAPTVPIGPVAGVGPLPRVSLSYNSNDTRSGPLGPGWTHSYLVRAVNPVDGSGAIVIVGPQGRSDRYVPTSETRYDGPAGTRGVLVRNPNRTLTLRYPDNSTWGFDAGGRLLAVFDRSGRRSVLRYDGAGRLVAVTDPAGRGQVSFSYDGCFPGRLCAVSDWASPPATMSLSFDTLGRLERVVNQVGMPTSYTYHGAGQQLAQVINDLGVAILTVAYDERGRVRTQTNASGGVTRFDYPS